MANCDACARLYPLHILGRKWSYLTLRALRQPKAFSELQRELRFITNHILTREIKLLEEERLISNDKKYALTSRGEELFRAAEPLVRWSVKHAGKNPCPGDKSCSTCANYANVIVSRRGRPRA